MKLVIDIPEEIYSFITSQCNDVIISENKAPIEYIIRGIIDGTVLPKGHERLIAEPTETDISNVIGGNNDFAECIRDSVKAVFENATTIIEADKESNNADSN